MTTSNIEVKNTNNGHKRLLSIFASLIILTALTLLFVKNPTTRALNENDMAKVQAVIAKDLKKNRHDDDIEVVKIIKESGHLFVLYVFNKTGNVSIAVFQPFGILINEYQYLVFEGYSNSKQSKQIGKCNYYSKHRKVPEPLTIFYVYGANTDKSVYSYTVYMGSGAQFSRIIVDEDYFIDIYYINRFTSSGSIGYLHNQDGEVIGWI